MSDILSSKKQIIENNDNIHIRKFCRMIYLRWYRGKTIINVIHHRDYMEESYLFRGKNDFIYYSCRIRFVVAAQSGSVRLCLRVCVVCCR